MSRSDGHSETDSPEDAAFRTQARAWLAEHALRFAGLDTFSFDTAGLARAREWQRTLADGGYAGITWPTELGGRGGTPRQEVIFADEAAAFRVPPTPFGVGVAMTGPTILLFGTEEQKRRFLPPMLRGEEIWCQLFSEPGAGSDLANLSCRAERDGDEWIVSGQKVWTSGAQHSDFGILMARTDVDQPKHRGITYFLLPMHQDGVAVRPLRQMSGATHFNEVFLEGARVADANRLGDLNNGWAVAMATLSFERSLIGGGTGGGGVCELIALAQSKGRTSDGVARQALADTFIRSEVLRYLSLRKDPMLGNLTKLSIAWNMKLIADLALSVQGAGGMLRDAGWVDAFLSAPATRIAGGSDEVQRNIIGERLLGLPTEPRVDKGIPFKDTLRG